MRPLWRRIRAPGEFQGSGDRQNAALVEGLQSMSSGHDSAVERSTEPPPPETLTVYRYFYLGEPTYWIGTPPPRWRRWLGRFR